MDCPRRNHGGDVDVHVSECVCWDYPIDDGWRGVQLCLFEGVEPLHRSLALALLLLDLPLAGQCDRATLYELQRLLAEFYGAPLAVPVFGGFAGDDVGAEEDFFFGAVGTFAGGEELDV